VIQLSVKHRMLPLILNDHILHDYTCIHSIPHLIFRPDKCRELDNSESSPEHTNCTLDILPASLLTLRKPRILLPGTTPVIVFTNVAHLG
jgi:hypothetical protein